jgi:hypothetical protein
VLADTPASDAWQWEAAATVEHRELVERDTNGQKLLKESGPLARLRVTARAPWAAAGRLEFTAALAHARLDYAGRTQAGAPLQTHSLHDELEAGARWHPWPAFAWGDPSITLDALRFRRRIEPTASVGSVTETSTLWMPGVAWTGPSWTAGNASISLNAQWRASAHHHVAVDYGGLFDPSSLHGGRRNELALGATAAMRSGWSLSLQWRHARQAESHVAALYRAAVPTGTVRQPRIDIDDLGLSLAKTF